MEDIIACMNVLYPNVNVKFSTVKEYLDAIKPETLGLEEYETDFLPY